MGTDDMEMPEGDVEPDTGVSVALVRPSVADLLRAVESIASAMAAMKHRIEGLEAAVDDERHALHEAASKLESLRQLHVSSDAAVARAKLLREKIEVLAAMQAKRAGELETEISLARSDLARVADAIVRCGGIGLGRPKP